MTATILTNELTSLIRESKKKTDIDVRAAAEQSLSDLRDISVTSESQLTGDLLRRPRFAEPFTLACKSTNAKLAPSAVTSLQRLITARAIPADRLEGVVDALRTATVHNVVQVKILQTVSILLQNYSDDVRGMVLFAVLDVCAALLDEKRSSAVVSSTASATYEQLVMTVFEQASIEDKGNVFTDLCSLADGGKPTHLHLKAASPAFVFDLIGNALHNYQDTLIRDAGLVESCRIHLMPAVAKIVSGKSNFAMTVRALRIMTVLLESHMAEMVTESQTALAQVLQGLDNKVALWKRVLCMEFLRGVFANFNLLRECFQLMDVHKVGTSAVDDSGARSQPQADISNVIASLVRVAAEKPSLIGISQGSTIPVQRENDPGSGQTTSLESTGLSGIIGDAATADANVTGLSVAWSTVRTPYLDQLDKVDVSEPPSTYLYTLTLDCISAFAEGLAKYVMPLSIPRTRAAPKQDTINASRTNGTIPGSEDAPSQIGRHAASKYSMLSNPLSVTNGIVKAEVEVCAAMVEACWPAFLATCSTFLNAALDADFYHKLIRAIQKLTQVAGVLELSTPRDALLTTMAKSAVPAAGSRTTTLRSTSNAQMRTSSIASPSDSIPSTPVEIAPQSPLPSTTRRQEEEAVMSITLRNLLCLRALLNLGIALGASLSPDSWFTIVETLQQAEAALDISKQRPISRDETADDAEANGPDKSMTFETVAVQTASRRMFEASVGYDHSALQRLLISLLRFSGLPHSEKQETADMLSSVPGSPASIRSRGRMHQASRSVSLPLAAAGPREDELCFFILRVGEVARVNLDRLMSAPPKESGWELIFPGLFHIASSSRLPKSVRLQSISLIDRLIVDLISLWNAGEGQNNDEAVVRALRVLQAQYDMIYQQNYFTDSATASVDADIHLGMLDALRSILENCDQLPESAWILIFRLVGSPYVSSLEMLANGDTIDAEHGTTKAKSPQLVQPAFSALQLIGSDFLSVLSMDSLALFLRCIWLYANQKDDLNVALTSTNFFWNIAMFLQSRDASKSPVEYAAGDELAPKSRNSTTLVSDNLQQVWVLLSGTLMSLITDDRKDVRDSSIRIMSKVLEVNGNDPIRTGWSTCLQKCLDAADHLVEITSSTLTKDSFDSLDMMIAAVSGLLVHHSSVVLALDNDEAILRKLFSTFDAALKLNSLGVYPEVFTSSRRVVETYGTAEMLRPMLALAAIDLWQNHHPADIAKPVHSREALSDRKSGETVQISNQVALNCHSELFLKVYDQSPQKLLGSLNADQLLESMSKTVFGCNHPPYTSDATKLAPEQENVISFLPVLYQALENQDHGFIQALLPLARAALDHSRDQEDNSESTQKQVKWPSYVAFSNRCIAELGSTAVKLPLDHTDVVAILDTLADIINSKYTATPQGDRPVLWENATGTAISVTKTLIPKYEPLATALVPSASISQSVQPFLRSTVKVATAILGADGLEKEKVMRSQEQLRDDESFDIQSLSQLHTAILSSCTHRGEALWIDPTITRDYSLLLFHSSFVAEPFLNSLPRELIQEPLKNFSKVRPGTVCPPRFKTRLKIPYIALDALFSLASLLPDDDSLDAPSDASVFSATAAPFLLVRCAYTFKTFIADQPLRSRWPMPKELQIELLTILRKCLATKTNSRAFERLRGSRSAAQAETAGEVHLRLLYPLVLRVLEVWRKMPRIPEGGDWMDEADPLEIKRLLDEWLMRIGAEWELP